MERGARPLGVSLATPMTVSYMRKIKQKLQKVLTRYETSTDLNQHVDLPKIMLPSGF